MDPAVIAAGITAVPATIISLATLRSSRSVHKEVRTNHGKRSGDYIEETAAAVQDLKTSFAVHVQTDAENFAEIRAGQARLAGGQDTLRKGQTDAVQAIVDRDTLGT